MSRTTIELLEAVSTVVSSKNLVVFFFSPRRSTFSPEYCQFFVSIRQATACCALQQFYSIELVIALRNGWSIFFANRILRLAGTDHRGDVLSTILLKDVVVVHQQRYMMRDKRWTMMNHESPPKSTPRLAHLVTYEGGGGPKRHQQQRQ